MKVRGYYNVYTRNFCLVQGPSYSVFKSTHIMIEVRNRVITAPVSPRSGVDPENFSRGGGSNLK